jgi:predicted ATPase
VIRTLHIQGFKTATDVTLELGRLNVLIGANGAGKSNLLEAVGLLSSAAGGRVDHRALQARGVRLSAPAMYKSALRAHKRLVEQVTVEARSDGARYRVSLGNLAQGGKVGWSYASEELVEGSTVLGARSPTGAHLSGRSSAGDAGGPPLQPIDPGPRDGLGPLVKSVHGRGALAALLEMLDGFAIYAPCTPMLRERVADPDLAEPLGLLGGGLAECSFNLRHAPELWQRVQDEAFSFIDWASAVRFDASSDASVRRDAVAPSHLILSLRDRHLIEELGWVSARESNEGALYALFVFLLLLHPDAPRFLAIDNVDHSLSPRAVAALGERMQQVLLEEPERPQVLLTTQSPVLLDALDLRDDRVRLFTVTRDRHGVTGVRRIVHDEASGQAGTSTLLSSLWSSGALDGVPLL